MRIGIIGAGGAGLAAAWLLDTRHEVTLFEKDDHLGGHADTVMAELDGEPVAVDAGFEFFSDYMFPTFQRLVKLLGVPLRRYPATATFYTTDHRRVLMLPPFRNGRVVWQMFRPRALSTLLQFRRVLNAAVPLMSARDASVTLEQFLRPLSITPGFRDEFLYPFLLAGWCCEPEEFKQFAAYDTLRYTFKHHTGHWQPAELHDMVGGTAAYVRALLGQLRSTTLRRAAAVQLARRPDAGWSVKDAEGAEHEFDHVIVATNAEQACDLLAPLPELQELAGGLEPISYFTTTIAVHGDRRLMPADERHWSVVNVRWDGEHSQNTVWKGWKSKRPLFKSWVTYERELPEPLYARRLYRHPRVNAGYFHAQQNLNQVNGKHCLWLAGMYMQDVDCHESAVRSAVEVVRRIDAGAPRLQLLSGAAEGAG